MIESFVFSKYRMFGFYQENKIDQPLEIHESISVCSKIWRKIANMVSCLSSKIFNFGRMLKEEFYDPFVEKETEIEADVKKETRIITKEIELLNKQIVKFDTFIKNHPDLHELCEEYYKKNASSIGSKERAGLDKYPREYDTNNLFDNVAKLSHDRTALQYDLTQRVSFIKCNKEVYELFKKYVLIEEQRENSEDTKALLELTFTAEV